MRMSEHVVSEICEDLPIAVTYCTESACDQEKQ